MELDYQTFLTEKGLPFLLEANGFVVEGFNNLGVINIPNIIRSKVLIAFDKGGTAIAAPMTFLREKTRVVIRFGLVIMQEQK